jgi:hypothetical protein
MAVDKGWNGEQAQPQADQWRRRVRGGRVSVTLYSVAGGLQVHAVLDRLTEEGFYCYSAEPVLPGEVLEMSLRLAGTGTATGKTTFLRFRIRLVRLDAGLPEGYGLSFAVEQAILVAPSGAGERPAG